MKRFSEITTRDDLAELLGIKTKTLTYVLYKAKVDSFYTSFEIPKKTGGTRQIDAPTGTLKGIQERLAHMLWEYQKVLRIEKNVRANISHAFEKKEKYNYQCPDTSKQAYCSELGSGALF